MKFNVIIIDDSPLQLSISSHMVNKNENLNLVGSYSNPFLGLDAVNNSDVDLVLLDVEMPQIDGFSLQKLFTREVIVIINSTKPTYEAKAYSRGAVDFLHKPLRAEQLKCSINKVILSKTRRKLFIKKNEITTIAV